MSNAYDTSAAGAPTGSGGASPATFNYTIGSITDPIVWFCVQVDGSATVSAVTWNGTSMTLVQSVALSGGLAGYTNYLYALANPATGAHTFSITHTGTPNIWVAAISYAGASATGVPDASAVDQQTNNPTTVALTTVAANCWMLALTIDDNADAITLTAGGVLRQSNSTHTRLVDTNAAVAAGSNSFTFDHGSGAIQLETLIASFAPAASGGVDTSEWRFYQAPHRRGAGQVMY